jgi:hypothetical protein
VTQLALDRGAPGLLLFAEYSEGSGISESLSESRAANTGGFTMNPHFLFENIAETL